MIGPYAFPADEDDLPPDGAEQQAFAPQPGGGHNAQWAPWPDVIQQQPQQFWQQDQPMEEISVELSAVSNPSRSRSHSLTISDISPEELGVHSDSLPLQATVQPVQHVTPANPSATPVLANADLVNAASGENAVKPPSRQITIVYQRRRRRMVAQAPPEQEAGSNKASSSKA
ncbi:hypothetical protein GUJ93_ZPchr0013g37713 [Zizania palustris]|uniref:Uncharacterized protein n=1 Tax=Zizania palustris TaxID=103762 RepID=A0A8J6BYF8_ZIZPA|nr:hypothetical protein GUJ93_ZPchr0013g37713 [Zizania palustris]